MKVILIAAMTPSGVIGRTSKPCDACGGDGFVTGLNEQRPCSRCLTGRIPCNDLPWGRAYPEIDARLDAITRGNGVLMDLAVWKSGRWKPLTSRALVVLSRSWDDPPEQSGLYRAISLDGAIAMARDYHEDTLCIVGGARLFAEALPIADELDLTLVGREYEGDIIFPSGPYFANVRGETVWHHVGFDCVSREPCPPNADLTFTTWRKR